MVIGPGRGGRALMAFIRKSGNVYYLVHNYRKQGRVRQLYLARLGRRARINDEVIEQVIAKHPLMHIDWKRIREKSSEELLRPSKVDSRYLRRLLLTIRNVHLEIGDLQLPDMDMPNDHELRVQLAWELKDLQETLSLKLPEFRRRRLILARNPLRSAN